MWGGNHLTATFCTADVNRPPHFFSAVVGCVACGLESLACSGDVMDTTSCGQYFGLGSQKLRAGDEQVVCVVDGSVAAGILLTGLNRNTGARSCSVTSLRITYLFGSDTVYSCRNLPTFLYWLHLQGRSQTGSSSCYSLARRTLLS
jgi:hypothetical protein